MLPRRPFHISRRRFMAAALAAAPAALSAGCLPPAKRDQPTQPPRLGSESESAHRPGAVRMGGLCREARRLPRSAPALHLRVLPLVSNAIRGGTGTRPDGSRPSISAAFAVPALGPYDSRDAKVIEQHARWIAEAGVGAVNISWWGPGSVEDRAVPLVMDVMRAHDIRVTFHIEPYTTTRGATAGRRPAVSHPRVRRAPPMGHLPAARGCEAASPGRSSSCSSPTCRRREPTAGDGSFPSRITPRTAPIAVRSMRVRTVLRADFDPIVLSDSLDAARNAAGGFDGTGIYNPYIRPDTWRLAGGRLFRRGTLLLVPHQPRIRPLSRPAALPGVPLALAVRAADRGHRLGHGGAR